MSLAAGLGTRTSRATAWLAPGTIVDDTYRIERAVGAGGMAVVYLAHDLELDRSIALKAYDVEVRSAQLSRIYREARAMARLTHPNVLVVFGVGVHGSRVFIAMEYVTGGTLHEWLHAAPRSTSEIVAMFVQCARGLAAAHAVGVVHGDFKPPNVLVGSDGRARVADFGLARLIDPGGGDPGTIESVDEPRGFAGTVRYAAPEQLAGRAVDAKVDQFAFCVAMFEALTGAHPFAGDDGAAIADAVRAARLRPQTRPLPRWIERVLTRGLAHAPEQRFASMDAVVTALQRDPSRRRTQVVAAAVVLTTAGGLGLASQRDAPCVGVADRIDAVWNEATDDTIAEGFARSQVPDAAARADTVSRRIDAWAQDWRAQRNDACTATHERATQSPALLDRRMSCLDRQLERLSAVVGALSEADRATVIGATEAIAGLPVPAACADVERLLAAVAPPDDTAVASAVAEQRGVLARAATAIDLADYPEALAIASTVRSSEAATTYAPLGAEAALLQGQAQWRMLEHNAGEAALTDAYHTAIASGDDELAARAARELVCDVGGVSDGLARASVWVTHATSLATRTHLGEVEQLELDLCRAVLRQAEGHAEEAETMLHATHERAVAIAKPDSLLVARVDTQIGRAAVGRGHYDEGLVAFERAYAEVHRLRGPTNPLALAIRGEIGRTLDLSGRRAEALVLALDTLQSFVALHGPGSARVVEGIRNVASALSGLGLLPQEAAFLEQGIALARTRGDQDRLLALMLSLLASNYALRGDEDKSVEIHREAIEVATEARGSEHLDVGVLHLNLGAGLSRFGRMEEAVAEYRQALAILEPALGEWHVDVGVLHLNLATATFHLGDRVAHTKHLDRAEAIMARRGDAVPHAMVLASRCMAMRADGDFAGSRASIRRALEVLGDADAGAKRMHTFALGHDELKLGDAAAALAAFTEARALAVAADMPMRVAAADTEIAKSMWMLGRHDDARALAQKNLATLQTLGDEDAAAALRTWLDETRRGR